MLSSANTGILFSNTLFKICVRKVGDDMSKQDIAKQTIQAAGGIVKAAELVAAGLTKYDVTYLCNRGYIERVRHGYYKLSDAKALSEPALIAKLIPEGIVCVESALFYYGYSDFSPRTWTLAVPRILSRTKLKEVLVPIKAYFVQKGYLDIGKTSGDFDGITLPIYDRERTICDCFKYRSRLDSELFNKALNAYVADDEKNLGTLSSYAKQLRIYRKVMDVMEVLLND